LFAVELRLAHQASAIESNPHDGSAEQPAYRSPAGRESARPCAAAIALVRGRTRGLGSTGIALGGASRLRVVVVRNDVRSPDARASGFWPKSGRCPTSGQNLDNGQRTTVANGSGA
jgi:hypothetical protein